MKKPKAPAAPALPYSTAVANFYRDQGSAPGGAGGGSLSDIPRMTQDAKAATTGSGGTPLNFFQVLGQGLEKVNNYRQSTALTASRPTSSFLGRTAGDR